MGSRLGTLNIGTGRGPESQDRVLRLVSLRLSEREDLGSELELEMNPDLRLSKATCFFAQLLKKLPPPQFYTLALGQNEEANFNLPSLLICLERLLSGTNFGTCVSKLKSGA